VTKTQIYTNETNSLTCSLIKIS